MVVAARVLPNSKLRTLLTQLRERSIAAHNDQGVLCVEMMEARGMPTSNEELLTCVAIGRFIERWGHPYTLITRRDVKLHICGSSRAKDPHVRQALIDRFGGQRYAIGGKKCGKCKGKGWFGPGRPVCPECEGSKWEIPPGPLHGVASHAWAALGVAACYSDLGQIRHATKVQAKKKNKGSK
jgi:hypothetical protein